VLLSHDHHDDNLDGAGRALLSSASTAITTIPGAKRLGGHARGLGHGRGRGWSFQHGLRSRSRHTLPPSAPVDPPDRGRGDWVRASVGRPGAGVLWISGDTVLYDLVRQVAHRLQVGTALLHLGGALPDLRSGALHHDCQGSRRAVPPCSPPHRHPDPREG